MADDKYLRNQQKVYDLLKGEGYTDDELGGSAENLFKDRENASLAFQALSNAGYSSLANDEDDFVSKLYAPETETETVTAPAPVRTESQRRTDRFNDFVRQREAAKGRELGPETPEQEAAGKAEVERRMASQAERIARTQKPKEEPSSAYADYDYKALEEEYARKKEEYAPLISEYEAKMNVNLSSPEDFVTSSWLGEHNTEYNKAIGDLMALGSEMASRPEYKSQETAIMEQTDASDEAIKSMRKDGKSLNGELMAAQLLNKKTRQLASQPYSEGGKKDALGYLGGAIWDYGKGTLDRVKTAEWLSRGLTKFVEGVNLRPLQEKLQKMEADLKPYEGTEDYEYMAQSLADDRLTEEDKVLLGSYLNYGRMMELRENNVPLEYRGGQMFADTAGYMIDFLLTRRVDAVGRNAMGKALGKWAPATLFGKGIKAGALELGGAFTRTLSMVPQNLGQIGESMTEMETVYDENGNVDGSRLKRNVAEAVADGLAKQFIEVASEGSGEIMQKAVGTAISRYFKRSAIPKTIIGRETREFLRGAGGLIRRGQFQGMGYEDLEEILGATANVALGKLTGGKIGDEDALKQTLSLEAQQEMLLGFLPLTAVSTLGSLKAANRMQADYDESMRKWEELVQNGAGVTEEDLNGVIDGLENKSTEDLMKSVANINEKIRKSDVGMPETEVRDMMNKIIAGRLAYDLQGELWDNSEDRMALANAYASAYGMPVENNLYDITQTVATAEAAAKEHGFTDEELNKDASVLMLEAEGMEERGGREAERAETLKAYAMAKAQQQAITDGYQKETADMLRAFEEPIMNLADNDGTLVVAQTADGQEVYVASKDAIVGADGKVSAPTGPDGLVSILYGDGTTATVKANTLAGAQQVDTETYLMDKEYEFNEKRAAEFQQAQDTISASGMAQAVGELTGQTVFVNGNGAYEPVRVERMTHGGEYTVISGDKEALKGIATALGIQSPGGSMLEAPTTGLYEILAKDDDGSISTDMQAAPQETAPQEAPAETEDNSPESLIDTRQTITYKGQPLEVTVLDVSDGKVIFEDGDGLTDSIPVNEFYSRMQAQEATAPVAETEAEPETVPEQAPAEPADTEVGIPIDETTGEPIYDAEGVTPEQAYNDIYGRFGEDTSDADSFVVEQSTAADKAYKKAQKASEKAESEKAEIDKWKRNPGEGLNAFAKRKADAKAEVDKKTAKATENIPELKRKADFWNELREVADANIAEAKAEAERQKLIEQYGVDPSGFDLTPQTMEEALADELYAHFKSGYKLSLASVLDLVGWNMLKDLRKGGYGFVLSRKPEAIPVDKFVMGVADEYPGLIKDEQDAINMVGDLLMRNTRGELGQFIFNARLEEARKQAENEEAPVAEAPVDEEIPVAEAEAPAAEEETVEDLPEEIAEEETTTENMPEEIAEEAATAEETVETPAEAETETEEVAEETPAEEEVAVEEEAPVENIEEENTGTASETEKESVNSQSVNETQEEAPVVESELTEDEIRNSGYPDEDVIDAAIDYINGDRSISSTAAYNLVKEYVRPQRNATEQTRGDADGTQLDGPVVQPTGVGAERSGGEGGELGGSAQGGTAERIPGNPNGGVSAGEGGTASATGAGRESDVQDSGSNVRGGRGGFRKSGRSNADVPAENGTPSQSGQPAGRTEAGSTDIAALGGELEDLLKQFGETNYSIDRDINGLDSVSYSVEPEQKEEGELSRKKPKKPTVPLSFEGLTPKQIELAGKIIFSSAKLGYAFVKTEGLASFNDFRRWFKSKFGDAVMKGLNYDESSLDAFINEVWNTKLKIDGQRLTLAQHASELHNEELRKNSDLTPAERTRLQKEANEKKIPFKAADRKNIAEALPQLNPGQWDDLVAIERQFYDPSHDDYDHAFGKGMMITNGTGTGKTYTGLGTIKRFVDQGKGRILLVAPAGMTSEWVEKGKAMGIKMSKLADTKDKGEGVVVTSYQNFRENKALYEDDFDLVVYDESHNILENQQGDETIAYEAHKRITNKNVEEALDRLVANTVPGRRRIELENENKALEAEAKKKTTKQGRQIEIEMRQTEIAEEIALLNPQIEALKPQFREHAQKAVEKTKVLFLSATPFNTIENLKYAEGYIYQYPKVFRSDGTEITDEEGRKSAFVTEWFRGDEPMEEREIAFGDHLLDDLETVSYRELENGFDHSRDFPDVSGNIMASRFNFAFQSIMRNPKYNPLKKFADSLFGNSTWTTQLYETMKASALRDRLKEHLDAGRKIVIFHDRMHESKASDKLPAVGPPFQTILDMALMDKQAPIAAIMAFKQEFADILKWEAGLDYRPVQEQVVDFYATDEDRAKYAKKMEQYEKKMEEWRKECDEYERAHPNMEPEELFANLPKAPKKPQLEAESVAIYNGEKTDKEKEAAKAAFNDDNSKVKIICVTTRSGGAGLSLHDTTGKHPRVMIQTALPVSPIGFIQAEGRIFRWGNRSNAAFEYPRLGLDVEAMKFAMDFNAKAETVENLAHGFRGRGLKDSIMTGFYENSGNVPIAGQGIGGVEMDKRGNTLKGMAKAKHDYGVAQRKGIKAGDKSIPETIGYVLSGWGLMQSGDQALVPFAGRGSIARYMPKGVSVSALEQDIALQADLFVTAGGDDFKLREGTFTELNPINKADVVILNGNTDVGLSQIETMRKGFLHLSEGGRLIAIVPNNEKEIEFTIKDLEGQGAVLRSTVLVNNSAIDAGNDGVSRIIVVDKVSKPAMRAKAGAPTVHDLTKAEKEGVPALIEAIKMPERIIDKQAIAIKKIKTVLTELRKNKLFGAINVYDESGARARVGFEMANRLPKGTNQSKYRFDSLSNRGFYYTGKWFQIPYSDFEKVNENNYLITAYQWLKEVVALPDDAFIRKAEIESNANKETIDAFRDMYRQYMKFIRAGFGLTESQIQRVASGLQPDISAADIDTLNSYSELRAKFEAANHGDEERQDLYDKVAQVGEKIGLTIGAQTMDRDFLGGYNNKDNTLMVNKNRWNGLSDEKRAQTLLHEFIHSVTVYAIAGYDTNAPGMSDALFDAAKLASDVYDQITKGEAVDVRPFTGQYSIENVKELLAEMASSETKEKLQNRRMWVARTPRGIRVSGSEMDGAEQTTAWNLLNEALDGMLKNFDKSLFDRFRGRVSDFFFELDREGGYTRDADLGAADMRENGSVDESTDNGLLFRDGESVTEEETIRERAVADGTFMKAPNGKPTNLTEKQWLQVRTAAFKEWFGDWENDPANASKIVDENGEPLVVYHGTKRQFWAFDGGKTKGKFTDGLNYFALDRDFSERWIARDDAEWREPETNERLERATAKRIEKGREVVAEIKEKYGDDVKYYDTPEWKEFWDRHEEWERENLDLDGMTLEDARYYLGNRILPVFINSRKPYNPAERYDSEGRQMLIDLGELSENPDRMDEAYARGGSYIYYEKKSVVDELKKRGYDSIYLSENVWSDPSKNLRTIAVWDANRIKSATDNTGEFSAENPDIRYREGTPEERRIVGAEIEATNKTLDRMGEALGVKINRVSRSEMPTGHRTDKGYYNPSTGEMTICMDNVTDERDAIATVLHETVGHKGLRELFGPRFREAMTNIYASLDRKGRAWVNGYIASHGLGFGNEGIVRGMEEYMAHLAESGDFQNTVWDRIKEIIGKIVDLVFGTDGFVFTDRELNYILRASYEHLKDPNWLNTTIGKAKDTLWKRELGINETDPNRPTDPDGPGTGILFRDGDTGFANEDYNDEMDLWHNQMIMENQDADRPVKIGMEKVMKETGKKEISEDEDYLRRHNVASSRAESEAHNYELFHFTPLLETVRAIQEKLISGKPTKDARQKAYERVLDYIYAVSGLERNEYKNNEIEQQKQEALEGQTDPKKIAKISAKYDAMKRDWAGITSLTHNKREDWQKANADAQALVDDFKAAVGQDALLDELWDRIRSCTDYSLEHAYKYGLLTREEFERLHGTASQPRMWEYYVPLRGFNEETAEEVFDYSSFLSPSNDSAVVKKMKGRWTQADNPLANILNIAESEIVQGNDNWAKQALYRFTLDAGENSLLTQVEPWYVKNPATGTWTLAEPDENESLEKFEERMRALADMDTPLAKKGRRGLKLDKIMANKAHRNEHMIRLKVRGVEKMIWVNGNPALAKAVTGIGRSQNMQWLRRASRVLSNLFTTYSLDFSIKNLIRDTIYSRTALIVKEDKAYRRKFAENWRKNFGYGAFAYPMVRLAADWESGKLQSIPADQRTKKQQMFIDFMTDGGQTGYTIINSVNEIKKSLERSMRRSGKDVGGVTVPILGHYAKAVKTLNEGFELLTRFTAYETSRDMGRSGLRSASDAKEISVNFNRRGAQSGNGIWGNIAAYLGATHYFYNAGVQGFENFLRLFKSSPKKMGTITVGIAMMGILTPLINSMFAASGGGDDDWYWNLPEWVRRNNLIIGTGRSYLAIPLPVEFRAIYGLGDIAAAAFCYQKYPNRTFGRVAGDMISTASGILPVNPVEGYTGNGNFGDAVIRAVAPDAGMFFVDWATNRDYTGRPLWKENPFSDTVPKSQGAYASTPKGIVNACQALAQISAGAIDVPPGLVRDFMNNYGGGFFRAAEDVSKIITGVIGKDPDRPFRYDNIPFLSGFTGHIDEDRSNSFATNALREYKDISEGIVKKVNAVCNTDEITAAMVYGDKEIPEQYASKVRVQRILSGKDYLIGKEYRDGMNNKYKMKQYVRGDKIGQWYKSKEVEEFGVNALKKKWSDLREEWAAMPSNTEDEKSAKAEKHLEVDDAWHEYYNAEGDLAEKLMKIEYGKQ